MFASKRRDKRQSRPQGRATKCAVQAFRHWIATDEGRQLWLDSCAELSLEGNCNALAQTQAARFGLLLAHRGAII